MENKLNSDEKEILGLYRRSKVIKDVNLERFNQNSQWGEQYHDYATWYTILGEEFGEVGQAIQQGSVAHKETDADDLYKELVQVAAVAVAIAEQVIKDRVDSE